MKILILGHHGLANRGCEALLRSTVALVRSRHPDARFLVPSVAPEADAQQWPQALGEGITFIEPPTSRLTLRAWARACQWHPPLAARPWPAVKPPPSWASHIQGCDVALVIGGDNWTLDYGLESLAFHVGLAEWVQRRGCPVVLWGASCGPFDGRTPVGQSMARALGRLQGATFRESISLQGWQALAGQAWPGEPHQNHTPRIPVALVADPAFTLQPQSVDLSHHLPAGTGPLLGLNLSPLTVPGHRDEWLENISAKLRDWCGVHQIRVLLIPHVSARDAQGRVVHPLPPAVDDDVVLDALYQRLRGLPGIARLPAWNAAQLKSAIGQCDLFIGARTHSVIAALSSGVPSVALSYSLKARGIHRDLFGHEDGVLPLNRLSAKSLDEALQGLWRRAPEERRLLSVQIPHWQARAREGLEVIDRAIG